MSIRPKDRFGNAFAWIAYAMASGSVISAVRMDVRSFLHDTTTLLIGAVAVFLWAIFCKLEAMHVDMLRDMEARARLGAAILNMSKVE